jgi:hypothetical protein
VQRLEQSCEQALARTTDWAEIYAQLIHLGISDPLFHAERFNLVPVGFLRSVSENLVKQKQQTINADSVAVAKLACLVHSALGGKKNAASLDSFLPFEKAKDENGLKDSTINAMKWAMKNEKLPPAVVGIIGPELS